MCGPQRHALYYYVCTVYTPTVRGVQYPGTRSDGLGWTHLCELQLGALDVHAVELGLLHHHGAWYGEGCVYIMEDGGDCGGGQAVMVALVVVAAVAVVAAAAAAAAAAAVWVVVVVVWRRLEYESERMGDRCRRLLTAKATLSFISSSSLRAADSWTKDETGN